MVDKTPGRAPKKKAPKKPPPAAETFTDKMNKRNAQPKGGKGAGGN